jgi:hypothetical protein
MLALVGGERMLRDTLNHKLKSKTRRTSNAHRQTDTIFLRLTVSLADKYLEHGHLG